jgi:hypothetical protein
MRIVGVALAANGRQRGLALWTIHLRPRDADHLGMARTTPIRRLTLIPSSASDASIRRYQLARLDEVALATPPDPAAAAAISRQEPAARTTPRPR